MIDESGSLLWLVAPGCVVAGPWLLGCGTDIFQVLFFERSSFFVYTSRGPGILSDFEISRCPDAEFQGIPGFRDSGFVFRIAVPGRGLKLNRRGSIGGLF